MLLPIFTSSKQHIITVRGKLLNSKKCFGANNNTWTLQQPNNKQQKILSQCSKMTLTHKTSFQRRVISSNLWHRYWQSNSQKLRQHAQLYRSLQWIVDQHASTIFDRIFGKFFYDLDLWTYDLENRVSSWPNYTKYLGKFWLKSSQWFTSHRVHKIIMAITGWPWPSIQWPSQCHQCHVDLLMINCDPFH